MTCGSPGTGSPHHLATELFRQQTGLNRQRVEALNSPAIQGRMSAPGIEAMPGTAEELTRFSDAERERWGKVIREAGIQLD